MSRTIGAEGPGRVALADLIALNDEIAALVRAGVPLGRGLAGAAGDLRGRLGALATRLGGRIDQGTTLSAALEAEGPAVPPLYRAVVDAGLRAGRLPAALEGIAGFARSLTGLRRTIGLALVYPCVVLVLAYLLFIAFVLLFAPRLVAAFDSLQLPIDRPALWLQRVGELAPYWAPVPPVLGLIAWSLWMRSGRANVLEAGRLGAGLGWIPWMKPLVADTRAAMFAELLAVLLDNQVPLPDALGLAGRASGASSGRVDRMTDALRRGGRIDPKDAPTPMIGWIIATGREQGGLSSTLLDAAALYRQRAADRAELIQTIVPAALVILIGGTAALAFGLTLFVPFTRLLQDLTL